MVTFRTWTYDQDTMPYSPILEELATRLTPTAADRLRTVYVRAGVPLPKNELLLDGYWVHIVFHPLSTLGGTLQDRLSVSTVTVSTTPTRLPVDIDPGSYPLDGLAET